MKAEWLTAVSAETRDHTAREGAAATPWHTVEGVVRLAAEAGVEEPHPAALAETPRTRGVAASFKVVEAVKQARSTAGVVEAATPSSGADHTTINFPTDDGSQTLGVVAMVRIAPSTTLDCRSSESYERVMRTSTSTTILVRLPTHVAWRG